MQWNKKLELPKNHTTLRNMGFVTADQTTTLTSASSCGRYLMLSRGEKKPHNTFRSTEWRKTIEPDCYSPEHEARIPLFICAARVTSAECNMTFFAHSTLPVEVSGNVECIWTAMIIKLVRLIKNPLTAFKTPWPSVEIHSTGQLGKTEFKKKPKTKHHYRQKSSPYWFQLDNWSF